MTGPTEALIDRTLAHGLRLVYEPMPWLPTVSLTLQLPVGSVTDPDDAVGSAAVLSEWLQRGAGGRSAREQADALDRLGVRRGGGVGRESMTLSAAFLARDAAEVLPLIAQVLTEPGLRDEDFEGVRQLALQDIAAVEDNPAQRLEEALVRRYFESAHGRSAYGQREHLHALTAEGVRDDARRRLGPAGAILALAGGGDPTVVTGLVEATFGSWRGETRDTPPPIVREPHVHHVPADSAQVQIGLVSAAVGPDHPDWYPQQVAMSALDGNMGARLFVEVRERRGLVYSVGASTRLVRGHAYTVARAGTTPERAAETVAVLRHELVRLSEGIDAEEHDRAQRQLRSSLVMQSEASGARAARLAADVLHLGRPRSLDEVLAGLEAVDVDGVNAFLSAREEPRFTLVTLGPATAAGALEGVAA